MQNEFLSYICRNISKFEKIPETNILIILVNKTKIRYETQLLQIKLL